MLSKHESTAVQPLACGCIVNGTWRRETITPQKVVKDENRSQSQKRSNGSRKYFCLHHNKMQLTRHVVTFVPRRHPHQPRHEKTIEETQTRANLTNTTVCGLVSSCTGARAILVVACGAILALTTRRAVQSVLINWTNYKQTNDTASAAQRYNCSQTWDEWTTTVNNKGKLWISTATQSCQKAGDEENAFWSHLSRRRCQCIQVWLHIGNGHAHGHRVLRFDRHTCAGRPCQRSLVSKLKVHTTKQKRRQDIARGKQFENLKDSAQNLFAKLKFSNKRHLCVRDEDRKYLQFLARRV